MQMHEKLKIHKYLEAWCLLDRITQSIAAIENNYDIKDFFLIPFLKDIVPKYMKMFPYKFFFSRESVIEESHCSICNRTIHIRHRCKHVLGKLYMGEICIRIITKIKLVAISIVENPVDKYAVLEIPGQKYDYSNIDRFMNLIDSPFQYFEIQETDSQERLDVRIQK